MKINEFVKLGLAAFFSLALVACSSTGSDSEMEDTSTSSAGNGGSSSDTGSNTGRGATTSAANNGGALSAEELREQQMLQTTVFYFDFDRSELKPEARDALVYHANALKASGASVRLEGHADERGTREYNLALGERRAQAVERYLLVQGVSASQLETISYGEEQPVATGTSEAAYARNRRVEMNF